MYTKLLQVTPEMAQDWLSNHNTSNRHINHNTVNMYAEDMLKGHWKVTHQGIAFAYDGTLIDGQHRLLAIIKSGVTVKVLVTRDLPKGDIVAIDQHKRRTTFDVMKIKGHGETWMTPAMLSAINQVYAFNKHRASTQTIEDCAEAIRASLEWVAEHAPEKNKGLTRAPVLAAIALIHDAGADTEKLAEFCSKLFSGSFDGKKDSAILRLREWLLSHKAHTGDNQKDALIRTEHAFNLFKEGIEVSRLNPPKFLPYPQKEVVAII